MLLFIVIQFTSVAQDPNYAGPAKMEVKTFWRQADVFKKGGGSATNLGNMEKALATIKQKDASYNIDAMETELKICKEKISKLDDAQLEKENQFKAQQKAQHDAGWSGIKADELLSYLFEKTHTVGNASANELLSVLNEYNSKAQELLAIDFGKRDRTNSKLSKTFSVLDNKCSNSTNSKAGGKQDKAGNSDSELLLGNASEDRAASFLYRLKIKQAYWDIAHKLFTQEAEYASMYQSSTAEINKYGTVEDLMKSIEKNNENEIKNRRLPVAVANDPTFEKFAIEVFNKDLSSELKGQAYKSIIMQKEWTIYRNDITGIILGRKRQVAIVYKGTDGKCYLKTGIIVNENYINGSFQNGSASDARYAGGELLCEYAK